MNLKSSKKGKHSKLAKLKTSFEMRRALISEKCQNIPFPGPRILGSPHMVLSLCVWRLGLGGGFRPTGVLVQRWVESAGRFLNQFRCEF